MRNCPKYVLTLIGCAGMFVSVSYVSNVLEDPYQYQETGENINYAEKMKDIYRLLEQQITHDTPAMTAHDNSSHGKDLDGANSI